MTAEAARAYIEQLRRKSEAITALLEKAGSQRRPRLDDVALYDGWRERYDPALIELAATCAKGTRDPMERMDRLLSEWQAAGVKGVEDAKAHRAANRDRRASGAQAAKNPALDYAQREYKDEDFGDDFFFDVVKEYKDGGDGA